MMDYIIKEEKNKHLIILVHGLNGSDETWRGSEQRFCENLIKENVIQDNFDLALFNYGTTILEISWIARIIRLIKGFFGNKTKENSRWFNVGIKNVSMPLVSQINGIHHQYDTVSFIAHSMGGLVTKSALTWLDNNILEKVYLFISLSVPHIGAHLATVGAKIPVIGNNPQVLDLRAMGEFTTQLNQRFGNINPQPKIVYQYGILDVVVPAPSAYPPNVSNTMTVATEDDHFSVLLINDRHNNVIYKRILDELKIVTFPFLAIDSGIPEGVSFKFFIEAIVTKLGVTIDFIGFSDELLQTKLRPGNINSNNFQQFLKSVRNFSINKLPEYSVLQERGTLNFTLKTQ